MVFHGGSDTKESACNAGDLGSLPGLEDSLGGEHGRLPWGCKESDMTEATWHAHT